MKKLMESQVFIAAASIAFFGTLAYLAVRLLSKAGSAAVDGAGKVLADTYLAATLPGRVNLVDGVVLPNGSRVTFNQIVAAGSKVDSKMQFVWSGNRYALSGRRPDGWYGATRVG